MPLLPDISLRALYNNKTIPHPRYEDKSYLTMKLLEA